MGSGAHSEKNPQRRLHFAMIDEDKKRQRQRDWMRKKRASIPKQHDAHIRAYEQRLRMKAYWDNGKLKPNYHPHTPESRLKLSIANRGKKRNVSVAHREWSRQHALSMIPILHSPQVREKIRQTAKRSDRVKAALVLARKASKASPLCQPLETNACATVIHVRSPRGEIYRARNAQHFVRTHPELFDPEDAKETGSTRTSRAARGLRNLNPANKSSIPGWKGWTWVSLIERRFDDGADPLRR